MVVVMMELMIITSSSFHDIMKVIGRFSKGYLWGGGSENLVIYSFGGSFDLCVLKKKKKSKNDIEGIIGRECYELIWFLFEFVFP